MADGTITLETKADEKGVKVGMKEIEASVKRMSSSVEGLGEKAKIALQKQLDSLSKLNNQYGQQEQKVEALRKRLKELSDQKIETEEYKRFGAEIKKLDNEFEKVEQKQREWLDMGFPADSMKNLDDQLDEIWAKMDKLQKKQAEMKSSGIAYVDPRSLSEYQSTASRLTVEEMRLDDMNNRLNTSFATTEMKLKECGEEAARSSSKFSGLAESARRFAEKLKQSGITGMKQKLHELWQALDKLMSKFMQLASGAIVGGLQKISGGIFAIHKSANKSTLSLKNLLKYAFGIRSLFALFNKLRGAIGEGIQNLAKYDLATQTGDVNTCLSELQSALTQLKNSFSTAFAPILTVVSPILVNFINLISQAVTRVGMLIAALTGQKTFVKAIAVQENYAASLDKTANSAKKAAKALQGYLSPIDEINRYDDGSSSDSGSGSGGGYSGPSAGDMFEEVPIESSLKGIADKIKELIQNEDWEGLGAYIADGINKGLQKIYNVINWDNVGPKVTKFITAFTTTFNSLVDHINWDLMGRTLGAGVNTLVNSLNLLIGNGGIDFNKIGSSIAKGLRGAIREINWTSLGELLGNKFMISWRMLSGFVNEMSRKNDAGITGWTELGKAVGKAMTGTFSRISFTDIAKALVGVINGAFETLAGFDNEFDWKSFQENLKSGIQTMVNDIDWKGNGKAFGDFLSHLCDCITAAIDNGTFQKLGEGIGEFLAELPWGKLLKTAASALIDGLGGALDGLWRSSLAGKITAGLIVAFGAVKVAQITGLDHLAAYLIGRLATKLISAENTAALTDGVETVLGNALKGATGAASDFAAALGPLVGTAGLIIAVGGAATVATSELAGFVETMQGGNGIGSTFGNTMNNFIQTLQHRGDIISGSAEEIWQLKESLEQEGMTAEDKASATQKLIDKLGEMGVTSDQAEQAFSSLYQQGLITDDSSLDRSVVSVRFILYAADGTTNQLDMQSVPVVIDVDALTHEDIFDLLTNNGSVKGVYKEGNQLYFSFTYAKGGTLKLGGPNNGYGTFEVYDANGNIITQIDNSVGFKNFKGKEWFQINESVATAGYDSPLVHGLLDLSAQYSDGYWTVLESKQAGLLLKTVSRMKVETTGSSSLTLNVPEMPKLITGSNLGKNGNGDVGTIASSSMHYKVLGKTVKEDELEDLYRVKVIWAKYKDGYLMEQDERCGKEMPMFIAEDIDRRFPIAVDHDEKGRAENWNYRIMIPCMFAMLKNEHEKVKDIQSELDSVKAELEELKQLIKQHISTEV